MARGEVAGGSLVVIDASVVVKWFVEEEYSREARLIRSAYADGLIDLAAPSIMPFEVLNALKYSAHFGEEELKRVASVLDAFQITLYSLGGELAEKTIEIAMRKGVTIYDASYVALAETLNTRLFTADEKLINRISEPEKVAHIRDFRLDALI